MNTKNPQSTKCTLLLACVMTAAVAVLALSSRCAHVPPETNDNGVPNLIKMRDSDSRGAATWRSGCPSPESWTHLRRTGVTIGLQLSYDDECDTSAAAAAGVEIRHLPTQPSTKVDPLHASDSVLGKPTAERLREIYRELDGIRADRGSNRGRLIFCYHGHDRTGLVAAWSRLVVDGWSVKEARREMLDLGFHDALAGLLDTWEKVSRDPQLERAP